MSNYSIPESDLSPLWEHQKQAIERAKNLPHFALFFEPGAGKTRTTIEILLHKYEVDLSYSKTGKIHNTMIICPKVIVEQWKREWEKFSNINPKQIICATGTSSLKTIKIREAQALQNGFIFITNFESLIHNGIFTFMKNNVKALVIDESSRVKDIKAQRTKRSIELADQASFRYILSGTPVLNSQLDIFSQFRILDRGETFGKNFFTFRARYFKDKNAAWKGSQRYFPDFVPKSSTNAEIRELIRPLSMVVKKEECMDLPPLIKQEVFVELSHSERKHYEQMKNSLITFLNDKACVAQMALTKCIRLQQLVSGFLKFDDDSEGDLPNFEKLSVLKELLTDITPSNKVIVWAIYKRNYKDIRKICAELKLGFAELSGEINDKDSEVQRFMFDSTTRVMIANPMSASLGLNLTSASYSIFYSRSFSLEHSIQAEARNHRGGSKEAGHKCVTRIDLIAKNTIDEVIMIALKQKLSTANEILDLLRKQIT